MSYKKVGLYEFNRENPFIQETIQHLEKGDKTILMGSKKTDIMIDNQTGEVQGNTVFLKRIKVDVSEFRKVYISNISQFFELSKAGIRVLAYVMSIQKINNDSFFIDYEDAIDFTGYKSKKTLITGLSELLENKFIARGKNNYHFYINPCVFWNGNRITFLKQFIQDDTKQITEGNEPQV